MKSTRLLLLLIVLFFVQAPLQAQHRTADSMVNKLFASLQQKDENAFLTLYPNTEQFGRFVKTIMQQVMKSDAMKQIFALDEKTKNLDVDSMIRVEVDKATSPKELATKQARFRTIFQQTIEKGEAKGVKWSEARMTGFRIDSTSVTDKEAQQFNLEGLKEASGVIDFSVGDSAYQLAFQKMMYIPGEGGWFGVDLPQVARKGESLAPDAADMETVTDTVTMTETVEPPPPPPPPAKKPARKSKQKTPARKPKA